MYLRISVYFCNAMLKFSRFAKKKKGFRDEEVHKNNRLDLNH